MTEYDDIFEVAKESAAALDPMFQRKGRDAIGLTAEIDAMDWRNSNALQEVEDPVMREEIANSLIASRAARREAAAKYELGEALKWSREEFSARFARNAAGNTADIGRALDLADAENNGRQLSNEEMALQGESFCKQFSDAANKMYAEHYAGMKQLGFSDAESLSASEVAMNKYVRGVLTGFGISDSPTKQRMAAAALAKFGRPEARYKDAKDEDGNVVAGDDGKPVKVFDPAGGLWLTDDDANDLRRAFTAAEKERAKANAAVASALAKQMKVKRENIAADAVAEASRVFEAGFVGDEGYIPPNAMQIRATRNALMKRAEELKAAAPEEYVKAVSAIDSAFSSASSRQKAMDQAIIDENGRESYNKAEKMLKSIESGATKVMMPFLDEKGGISYVEMEASKARMYILERLMHMEGLPSERKDEVAAQLANAKKETKTAAFANSILRASVTSNEGEGLIAVFGGDGKLRAVGASTYENRTEEGLRYRYEKKGKDGKAEQKELVIQPQFINVLLDAIQSYHERCTVPNESELRSVIDSAAENAASKGNAEEQMHEFASILTRGVDDIFRYRKSDGTTGGARPDFMKIRRYGLDDRSSDRGILRLGEFDTSDRRRKEKADNTVKAYINEEFANGK